VSNDIKDKMAAGPQILPDPAERRLNLTGIQKMVQRVSVRGNKVHPAWQAEPADVLKKETDSCVATVVCGDV
jgi:hypothetical protein